MTGTENRVRERETDTDKVSETDRYRDDRQKDTKRHKMGRREGADHTARGVRPRACCLKAPRPGAIFKPLVLPCSSAGD